MSSLIARINLVKNFLAAQLMFVDDEWLSGCVEYLTEDSSNNYSDTDLRNLAKEQWLLNDLKDICPGCLPQNLKAQLKTTLPGRYVLQINAAIDIGTPAYQQYLKVQKVNMENVDATMKYEDKISSHRMIKLFLTDGVQEINGIEYKPMRNLTCDITPGCKVIIKGPIECRRGVLLLTESSIELLGGEVQEIATTNSLAGLLSSKLGVTCDPGAELNTTNQPLTNNSIPAPHNQMPPSRPEQDNQILDPPFDQTSRPIARVTSLQVASNFNEDDIDIDQLAEIEAQYVQSQTSNKRSSEEMKINPEKKFKIDSTIANNPEDYPDDCDFFGDEDDEYLREMEVKFDQKSADNQPKQQYPVKVNKDPFVYIKQINEMGHSSKAGHVFNVKGQIMKLLSKLSVGKDGWSLKCTIVDGTGSIDVDFSSDVLSKLVGYTPAEMSRLKKEIAKQPELKQKAVTALQNAKDNLQVLYCIIELTIMDSPKITALTPYDETHVDMVKQRLDRSGL